MLCLCCVQERRSGMVLGGAWDPRTPEAAEAEKEVMQDELKPQRMELREVR